MKKFLLALLILMVNVANAQTSTVPTINSVLNINNGCWVNFNAPTNSFGAVYNYQYSLDNGATWLTCSPSVTEPPLTISGLSNCTSYSVKIRAQQLYGTSGASAVFVVQPKATNIVTNNWSIQTAAAPLTWNSVTYGNGLFVAVASSGFESRVMTSTDGVNWTQQASPDNQSWKTVAYGNGTFVALANNSTGDAMTSTDGINWTLQSVPSCDWESITYGDGKFVAVASSGWPRIIYSTDGITWSWGSGYESNAWTAVTYGNGKFVAVASAASNYYTISSSDGVIWTGSAAPANEWNAIAYGGGKFVALSQTGTERVMVSADGLSWSSRSTSITDNNMWTSITYGNGIFVAVGRFLGNKIMWSPDGDSWFSQNEPASDNWSGVTYGNGTFLAVAASGSYQGQVMTVSNSFSSPSDAPVVTAAASNGSNTTVYFAPPVNTGTSSIDYYEYSTNNGTTWNNPLPPITTSPFTISGLTSGGVSLRAISAVGTSCPSSTVSLVFAPGAPTIDSTLGINGGAIVYFTPPGSNGGSVIYNYEYSTDNGATWVTPSPAVSSSPLTFSGVLTNCTTGSVKIRAVNIAGAGSASASAIVNPIASQFTTGNFIRRGTNDNKPWSDVVFGNGTFVAVGWGGAVKTSSDGINWTLQTAANQNDWSSVTYGNGLFVAVAKSGNYGHRVMTSPDGITWTARSVPQTRKWINIEFGNGLFVATADGYNLGLNYECAMVSTNGINWTLSLPGDNKYWYLVYGDGKFLALPGGGTDIKSSTDGVNWTTIPLVTDAPISFTGGVYGQGKFILLGGGTSSGNYFDYLSSADGINWSIRQFVSPNTLVDMTCITYGDGGFVAIPYTSMSLLWGVFKSTDGISWTRLPGPTGGTYDNSSYEYFISVTYGNGRYVSVNSANFAPSSVMTSNFITTSTPTPTITSITPYHTSCFVNYTISPSVYSESPSNFQYSLNNGATWTTMNPAVTTSPFKISGLTNGTSYNISIRSVNSGGNSCPSNTVSVTPNIGVAASAPVIDTIVNRDNSAIVFFTPPTSDGGSPITNYQYSVDSGTTWITRTPVSVSSPLTITGISNCTRYAVYIRAVNATGGGAISNKGGANPRNTVIENTSSWTEQSCPSITGTANGYEYFNDIAYGNGVYVVVGSQGSVNDRVLTSPDIINWTKRTAASLNSWDQVVFGNGIFLAAGNMYGSTITSPKFMTSPDGINWTLRPSPISYVIRDLIYANGKFWAIGYDGSGNNSIISSTDGVTWSSLSFSLPTTRWYGLTYGNGLFILFGGDYGNGSVIDPKSYFMTSTDGITWTSRTDAVFRDNNPRQIIYGGGKFVATCLGGGVITSNDGLTWVSRGNPSNGYWYGLAYGNGIFTASEYGNGNSNGPAVMNSTDGITWTVTQGALPRYSSRMKFSNGMFISVNSRDFGGNNVNQAYSSPVCTSIGGIFQVPDAPTINAISTSAGNGSISFTQPVYNGGSPITNYEYSIDNGNNWTTPSPEVTSSPLLMPGDTLGDIRIRAINSVGASCPSTLYPLLLCYTSYGTTDVTICSNQLPYIWNGNSYNTAGTYVDTLINAGGCDSVATLNLTINQPTSSSFLQTACGSYVWHGTTYTTSGAKTWTGTNAAGCDSVVTLNLTINQPTSSSLSQSACVSYLWHGTTYTTSGAKTWTGTNAAGCDSVVTLDLTIKQSTTSSSSQSACGSYVWHGTTFTTSGSYTWTGVNAAGCDSIVTLNLTVNNSSNSTTNVSICNNQLPYIWNAQNYTASGIYTWTGTNAVGCDSTATLNLTVRNTSSYTQTVTACGSYSWHGTTYTASNNTATWSGTNAVGCDSVVTLNLTIIPNTLPANSVSGISNVCPYIGTNTELTYTAFNIPGATYTWTIPSSNVILVSGQGTNTIKLKFTNGFANVNNKQLKVKATTATCGSTDQIIFYLLAQAPVTPSNITASGSSVCTILGTNSAITYKTTKSYAAVSYIWSAQNGTTNITSLNGSGVNDTAVSVTFASNFTSSAITVQSVNDCGVSQARSLIISRDNPPTPSLISGPANVCEYIGASALTAIYTVPALANANSYTWSIPTGAISVSGQGSNSVSFKYPAGYTGGNISVTATNGCGTGGSRSMTISKLSAAMPSVIDVINTGACPSRTYSYTLSGMPLNATSVQWTVPAGGTIVSGQGTTSITVSYPSTIVSGSVTAKSVNNCSVSSVRSSEVRLPACSAPGFASNKIASASSSEGLSVKVFPNPTTSSFNLQVITADSKEVKVKIMDVQGWLMKSLIVAPYQTVNIVNEFKAGVYMLETRQGGEVKTVRVVKY